MATGGDLNQLGIFHPQLQSNLAPRLFAETCILQTRTEGTGSYGYGKPTYTNGSEVACLYLPIVIKEEVLGAQAENIDGYVNFSRDTDISNLARVKFRCMHGITLSPVQVYEIVGGPIITHVGQKVKVRLVTDGSES